MTSPSLGGTLLDLLLLAILSYALVRGWQSGFVAGVTDLVGALLALAVALRLYEPLMPHLTPLLGELDFLAAPLGFVLAAAGTRFLYGLLARAVLTQLPPSLHRARANRLLGLLPGLLGGLISAVILASLLLAFPSAGVMRGATEASRLAGRLALRSERVDGLLSPIFDEAIDETLNLVTVHPRSDELVELPYTVVDPAPAPELEAEMLALINQERARAGLPPLAMDAVLTRVARRHSLDMFARGYFSHSTPEGQSPYDRIEAAGARYLIAGENLAHAATLSIAHNGLMNSPGHRENILRPEFGRVGIGILDGGPRGLMITQNFRD